MTNNLAKLGAYIVLGAGLSVPASAQSPFVAPSLVTTAINSGDTAWMLGAALFALLLTIPGLALFYSGRTESRNVLSVALQIGGIAAIVSLLWIIMGYTLAFGIAGNGVIGAGNAWMLIGLGAVREGTFVPESAYAFFQMAPTIFAAAIMVGAWTERAKFGWVIAFAALWSLIVYAPIAHWIMGNGWLATSGTIDYAGGITIHISAGVSALVAAIMIGRREGWPKAIKFPSSPALTLAGAGLIWAGWLALIGGNELTAGDGAASAMLNAHVAACVAALVWLLMEKIQTGYVSATGFAQGLIAGLVTISASAGYVSPGGAILIGAIAAPLCYIISGIIQNVFAVDDSLDVFATHGFGGILGALLAAIFVSESFGGLGYDEGIGIFGQIVTQLMAIGVTIIWSVVGTLVIGVSISLLLPMRAAKDDEEAGLDKTHHGERAWDIES